MGTHTWTLTVHRSGSGRVSYSVTRAKYTSTGRQLPELLTLEDLVFGHLFMVADDFAALITEEVLAEARGQATLGV
jgi:hypothetical protein